MNEWQALTDGQKAIVEAAAKKGRSGLKLITFALRKMARDPTVGRSAERRPCDARC